MRKYAVLLSALSLAACGPAGEKVASAVTGELDPGLWRIDGRAGPGVPGGGGASTDYCLGGVMAAAPARVVIPHMLGMSACGADSVEIKDGKVGGAFQCMANGMPVRVNGEYKRDSMMVRIEIPSVRGPAQRMTLDVKRVGECTGAPTR